VSINDTARVVRMAVVGDATTWSITFDDSRGVIYDRNIFMIKVTDVSLRKVLRAFH